MKCPNCNANLDINPNDDEIICPQCNTVLHKSIECIYPTHSVYTPKEYREKKISLLIASLTMLFCLVFSVFFDTSKNYNTQWHSYDTSKNYNTQRHSYNQDSLELLFIFIFCIVCSVSYMKMGDEVAKFWGFIITVLAGIFGLIFLIRYIYGDIGISDYITYLSYFF